MTDVALQEGGDPIIIALGDQAGDALAASGIVGAKRLGGEQWEVFPATKVGVARVAGVTVRVRPKVDVHRILFMLGYARDPGWRADLVELAAVDDLVTALAQAFVSQATRATDAGLLQGYRETDDSLTVLRGRLRDHDQLRHRFGLPLPLMVRFDDYTVDIAENRILRAAAELLLRLPGVDHMTRHRLHGVRLLLAEVGRLTWARPLPAWTPTRLNARYHVALWLAELILAGNAVDQAPGEIRVSGFMVDMAKVYEDFLVTALVESFGSLGGRCRPKDRQHLDVHGRVAMEPDLVWYVDGQPMAVIDAKYKVEKPAGFPNADLYQMLAYCTALGLDGGHLVYAEGNTVRASHEVRNAGITIVTHTLDLDLPPAALLTQVGGLAGAIAAASPAPAGTP